MAPDFSWKIIDGDSKVVSTKSKSKIPPCEREGFAGCWVLRFSSSFAPKIYDARDAANPVLLEGKDAIVPGYYVQVVGSMAGNTGKSPGIYINHAAVGLRAYGKEIKTAGVDVTGKFGGAVPAGASAVPVGGFAPPAVPAPSAALTAPAAPAPAAPAPTAVVPAPGIVGIPTAPAAPPAPPAAPPAAPPSRPPHKGHPVEAYLAQGWTIEQLRADGYAG